jgi:hypothetical protein
VEVLDMEDMEEQQRSVNRSSRKRGYSHDDDDDDDHDDDDHDADAAADDDAAAASGPAPLMAVISAFFPIGDRDGSNHQRPPSPLELENEGLSKREDT